VDSFGQLSIGKSTVLNLAGTPSVGVYKLIDYAGSDLTSADFHRLVLGNAPTGNFYGVLLNNSAGTSVDYAVEAAGATNTWTGQTSGVWDNSTATNWDSGAFAAGQQVTFDDTGANKTVSGSAVSPQRITFNNTAGNDYVVSNP